jgi:hypothetical protein
MFMLPVGSKGRLRNWAEAFWTGAAAREAPAVSTGADTMKEATIIRAAAAGAK